MHTKFAVIYGGVIFIILGAAFIAASFFFGPVATTSPASNQEELPTVERNANPENTPLDEAPLSSTGETFTGVLQAVNTGCFADGECFITVDSKHVTLLLGWNQETVGSIVGAESIGDLENLLGQFVEVYAENQGDSRFTLYGNEDFYVRILDEQPADTPVVSSGSCVVAGCSAQLCVDANQGDIATDCMYREAYACYQTATCERQASGSCGWTETAELRACLVASE